MKFLDLFAGIGGFRLGLEMAGHECVGHVEIDKYANQSYRAIHQPKESEFFHEDITTITDESIRELRDRGIDIIAGGFPCQAFSIAGARRGFEDTRGTLFFDIARMARIIRPKYLFLENVKGLLNHDNGDTFETILRTLDELRYDTEWSCLNSKDFGVPQNRERVFIVGHLRGRSTRKVFPITGANAENSVELSDGRLGKWMGSNRRVAQEVYSEDGIFPCLTTKSHFNDSPKIAVKDAYVGLEPKNEMKFVGGLGEEAAWLQDGKTYSRNFRQGSRVYDADGIASCLNAQGVGGFGGHSGLYLVRSGRQEPKIAVPTVFEQRTDEGIRTFSDGTCGTIRAMDSGGDKRVAIPVLTPDRAEKRQNGRRFKEDGEPMFTITAQDRHGVLLAPDNWSHKAGDGTATRKHRETDIHPALAANPGSSQATYYKESNFRIRKLTPKECWRLQGFPDWAFERAKAAGVSDSQLYKQAGNSVTVNVIHEIAKRLK